MRAVDGRRARDDGQAAPADGRGAAGRRGASPQRAAGSGGTASVAEALAGVRALLLDMDGVLLARGEPIPGAAAAIARLKEALVPFRVITNVSLSSRRSLAQRLAEVGIDIAADQIVTALSAAADQLGQERPGQTVYLLGSAEAPLELATADARLLSDADVDGGTSADVVVIGDSEDRLTYENLNRAFRLLRAGSRFVAMHRNPWWLTASGPTLDSGALVAGLEFAIGRRAMVAGKPSLTVFRAALQRLSEEATGDGTRLRRWDVAMVGDDLANDLAPARRLGLRTVLVLTGKHGRGELDAARRRRGGTRPDVVASSIVEVADAIATARGASEGTRIGGKAPE